MEGYHKKQYSSSLANIDFYYRTGKCLLFLVLFLHDEFCDVLHHFFYGLFRSFCVVSSFEDLKMLPLALERIV